MKTKKDMSICIFEYPGPNIPGIVLPLEQFLIGSFPGDGFEPIFSSWITAGLHVIGKQTLDLTLGVIQAHENGFMSGVGSWLKGRIWTAMHNSAAVVNWNVLVFERNCGDRVSLYVSAAWLPSGLWLCAVLGQFERRGRKMALLKITANSRTFS